MKFIKLLSADCRQCGAPVARGQTVPEISAAGKKHNGEKHGDPRLGLRFITTGKRGKKG